MPGIVVSTADYATVGIRGCSLVLLCFFLLFYMFHKCTPTASCFDPSMQINIRNLRSLNRPLKQQLSIAKNMCNGKDRSSNVYIYIFHLT